MSEEGKRESNEKESLSETDVIINKLGCELEQLYIIRVKISDNLSRIIGEEVADDEKVEEDRSSPCTQLSKINELIYKIKRVNRKILEETKRLEQI